MQRQLMTAEPNLFPWGEYVGLDSVMHHIFKGHQPILKSIRGCPAGHKAQRQPNHVNSSLFSVLPGFTGSTQAWLVQLQTRLAAKCRTCGHALLRTYTYQMKPPLIALDISSANQVHPDLVVHIKVNDEVCQYHLRGILYFGGGHYVTRFISSTQRVWYHDGIETGRNMVSEGLLQECELQICKTRSPVVFIYVLQYMCPSPVICINNILASCTTNQSNI
jgi:hypothetical protein